MLKPQLLTYHSAQPQALRNVPTTQPSLIRVSQGVKKLLWHDETLDITQNGILLLPAGQKITFVNTPDKGRYHAQQLLLPALPSYLAVESNISSPSASTTVSDNQPFILLTPELDYAWRQACQVLMTPLHEELKQHYCYAVLLALKQSIPLTQLYTSRHSPLAERIMQLLQWEPAYPWQATDVAARLGMSEATLRRHLAQKNHSFRQLLTDVRLGYALSLFQDKRLSIADIAARCGYQSQEKFASRFKQQLGLTPAAYRRTF